MFVALFGLATVNSTLAASKDEARASVRKASNETLAAPGIWLYQFSDDGLALELTAKGTKYYRDEALN